MASMTITIPAEKWETYKEHFLNTYPNQTTDSDNPLTDEQWIKRRILLFVKGAYTKSMNDEFYRDNQPVLDPDMATIA
jgi:hypothetical protein